MSINMDGGGSSDVSYPDHEFQNVTGKLRIPSGNSDETAEAVKSIEPVDEQGLDNDELAELVYFEVQFNSEITARADEDNQTEYAFLASEMAVQVNGANADDSLPNLTADGDPWDTINDTDAGTGGVFVDDDPGRLFSSRQLTYPPFSSTTSGFGGGADGYRSDRYEMDYKDLYGTGPVLDANDDLTIFMETSNNNVAADCESQFFIKMVWRIHHVEDQRGQFALP